MPNEIETPDTQPASVDEAIAEMFLSLPDDKSPENYDVVAQNILDAKIRIADAALMERGLPDLRMLKGEPYDQPLIAERHFPTLTRFMGQFAQNEG